MIVQAVVEDVHGDDPDLASYLRIEERELEARGLSCCSSQTRC